MQQQQKPAPSQQVANIKQTLVQTLAQRAQLIEQLEASKAQIDALRSALQGVEIGEALAEEKATPPPAQ